MIFVDKKKKIINSIVNEDSCEFIIVLSSHGRQTEFSEHYCTESEWQRERINITQSMLSEHRKTIEAYDGKGEGYSPAKKNS